ncbi:peroxide stress protein YaaA [Aquabacterium lacunae]|nr:peroxide stress protein YaaA [Aquabacterium lacunae]
MSPATKRQRIAIDEDSWVNQLTPSAQSVILFVHGTFGDAKETWRGTSEALLTNPGLSSFDTASFGYSSKVFERNTPDTFTEKLRLWINTHLSSYTDIYIIAHSMGGLLVRGSICAMLNDAGENKTVKKIRLCFLVASPVTGSKVATFLTKIGLSKIHKRLDYLDNPKFNGKPLGKAYAAAVKRYCDNGGDTIDAPHFHIFTAERDIFVGKPKKSFYTKFDHDEGVLPGTHGSVKLELDINSTLITRVAQLVLDSIGTSRRLQKSRINAIQESTREREEAALASPGCGAALAGGTGETVDILLISCSNTKSDASGHHFDGNASLLSQLDDPDIRQLIFATRNRMLTSIQGGLVDGIEFSEGNRGSRPINKELIFGPDFGGRINESKFLPAYLRYKGRCYQATPDEWAKFLQQPKRPVVLIMSGLYGLLLATDSIQNYDAHLTDVNLEAGVSIQTYWKDRELMTEILLSHIKWLEKNVGPVGRVVDALSELSYQETINWSLIRHRWPVFHRVFEKRAGRDALANLGVWVRDVLRDPNLLKSIEYDQFYENKSFLDEDRIAFERLIGETSLKVMRQIKN